jgi:hypothetical protein
VDLGAVSDTFDTLTFQQSGWNVLDNIAIGDTLSSVTAVPEPSVAAIGGLGILALFALKRKNCAT